MFDPKGAVGKAAGGAYQRTREIGRLAFASPSREVSVDRRRFSNRRLFGFRNDSPLSPLSLAPYSVADDRPQEWPKMARLARCRASRRRSLGRTDSSHSTT